MLHVNVSKTEKALVGFVLQKLYTGISRHGRFNCDSLSQVFVRKPTLFLDHKQDNFGEWSGVFLLLILKKSVVVSNKVLCHGFCALE